MTALPKVNTFFPGAGCLLCIAAAEVANQSLTTHTQKLPHEDLAGLKDKAAQLLAKSGAQTKTIQEPLDLKKLPNSKTKGPGIAKKDFSSVRTQHNVDRLLVIDIESLGMVRDYANYFPTTEPRASITGAAYLVNLENNQYEWYAPLAIARNADGKWDEAPDFPGLTNAYYQVLELAKDSILKPIGAATTARAAAVAAPAASEPETVSAAEPAPAVSQ